MEGILAVGGFWLCMMAIVLKKPFMAYIEKSKTQQSENTQLMEARVQQLENAVAGLGTNMMELKDSTEFAQKMIIESSRKLADSHQLLIESTRQLALSQKPQIEVVASAAPPSASPTAAFSAAPNCLAALPPPQVPLLADNQLLNYDANLGKVVGEDTILFERTLPASPERLWQYLTKPEFLSSWLAVANLESKMGGRVELHFDQHEMPGRPEEGSKIRGLISCFEPHRKLSFSWIDTAGHLESVVSFELTPHGDQTALVLTHSRLPNNRLHEFMASWHTHLDVLFARLKNAMPPSFPRRYRELIQTYAVVAASVVIVTGGPAHAATFNNDVYQTVQAERSHLLARYDSTWKDADELQHRIDALKRENTPESSRTLGRLDSALQDEYRDLHQLELEIRDMNRALN